MANTPELILGITNCFAVKRWAEPAEWARIAKDELGLSAVQLSLDLLAPGELSSALNKALISEQAETARNAGLEVHSLFTGLAAYSSNLMLHSDERIRDYGEQFYKDFVDLGILAGVHSVGGHFAAHSVLQYRGPDRHTRYAELVERMKRIAGYAEKAGLETLQFENLGTPREPGSTLEQALQLESDLADAAIPWQLCLDVGHPVALSSEDAEGALAAWLTAAWRTTPVLQLQQSQHGADQHAPFLENDPQIGGVTADRVLNHVARWNSDKVYMFLEMIPSPEADDDQVLASLVDSARYWRNAISSRDDS